MQARLNCILLIDDDKLINLVNKAIIDETGIANYVIKKETAFAGLTYLSECGVSNDNKHCPDLILVDIDMPVYSGWDFIYFYNDLKDKISFSSVIYFLSASYKADEIAEFLNTPNLAGALKKPLTVRNLQEIVDKHFPDPSNL